jgi:hypothetical protein
MPHAMKRRTRDSHKDEYSSIVETREFIHTIREKHIIQLHILSSELEAMGFTEHHELGAKGHRDACCSERIRPSVMSLLK